MEGVKDFSQVFYIRFVVYGVIVDGQECFWGKGWGHETASGFEQGGSSASALTMGDA